MGLFLYMSTISGAVQLFAAAHLLSFMQCSSLQDYIHPLSPQFTTKPEQHSFCTAQIIASFGVKLAYGVKIAGNYRKQKA